MRTALALLVSLFVVGCSSLGPVGPKGDTGAQGPKGDTGTAGTMGATGAVGATGGGLYVDRGSAYCKEALGSSTGPQAFAQCDDFNDLIVTGGCVLRRTLEDGGVGLTDGVSLRQSYPEPSSLGQGSLPGMWQCDWAFETGVPSRPATDFGGKAVICCIRVP